MQNKILVDLHCKRREFERFRVLNIATLSNKKKKMVDPEETFSLLGTKTKKSKHKKNKLK